MRILGDHRGISNTSEMVATVSFPESEVNAITILCVTLLDVAVTCASPGVVPEIKETITLPDSSDVLTVYVVLLFENVPRVAEKVTDVSSSTGDPRLSINVAVIVVELDPSAGIVVELAERVMDAVFPLSSLVPHETKRTTAQTASIIVEGKEKAPGTACFLLDCSASITETEMQSAIEASRRVLVDLSKFQNGLSLWLFGHRFHHQNLTWNPKAFARNPAGTELEPQLRKPKDIAADLSTDVHLVWRSGDTFGLRSVLSLERIGSG